MTSVLRCHYVLQGYQYIWLWKAWANEMNFAMNHAPGAGSTAQFVDMQSFTQKKRTGHGLNHDIALV